MRTRDKNEAAGSILQGRRRFLATAGVAAAAAAGSGLLPGAGTSAAAATLPLVYGVKHHRRLINDIDIQIFSLNTEYLAATFYQMAVYGQPLADAYISGSGSFENDNKPRPSTPGSVVAGTQVAFTDPTLVAVAQALANDELGHVLALRAALGANVVARPSLDLVNSFQTIAVNAGIISAGETFSPYSSEDNFLLAAFMLDGTDVTAYHGAAPYIHNPTVLSSATGIGQAETAHDGAIRTLIYQRGQANPALINSANKLSALRASLDGSPNGGNDVGVTNSAGTFTIANVNTSGVTFARSFTQVLNILYGNTATTPGGLFPAGLNGFIS